MLLEIQSRTWKKNTFFPSVYVFQWNLPHGDAHNVWESTGWQEVTVLASLRPVCLLPGPAQSWRTRWGMGAAGKEASISYALRYLRYTSPNAQTSNCCKMVSVSIFWLWLISLYTKMWSEKCHFLRKNTWSNCGKEVPSKSYHSSLLDTCS